MDNGQGSFSEISKDDFEAMTKSKTDNPSDRRIDKVFREGEILFVKDSKFEVRHIDFLTGIMVIKLLPNH